MPERSLRQLAADTPLARFLVDYGEARGWTSGRQAAKYLGVKQAAFSTWLRGEVEPGREYQERLAAATGTTLDVVAALVRRTKAAKRATDDAVLPTAFGVRGSLSPGGVDGAAGTDAGLLAEVALPLLTGDMTAEERAWLEGFARRVRERRAAAGGRDDAGRGGAVGADDPD